MIALKHTLQFLGAAGCVTGSKFLLESNGRRVLVECGLFQGRKELRRRNWEDLPVDPSTIDAVILTHAHLDHSGYLPRLARQGFRGPVYCTPATRELLGLVLPDSGHIQEEDARYANRKRFSKHRPALPLYTKRDALSSLRLVRTVSYGEKKEVARGIRATFHPSGHILGAAFIELNVGGKRLVISGDVGSYEREVMRGPADLPPNTDVVLAESTYGGRAEDTRPVRDQLRDHIIPVLKRKGVVVIPAFAIGRTTLLLYHLRLLQESGEIPVAPVFVNSPMATSAVKIYCRYGNEHNLRVDLLKSSRHCPITARRTHFVRSIRESKELSRHSGPAIIISASGMASGGRVLHHLKNRLPRKGNLVLLAGYQAIGTRGRALLEGADHVKIHGRQVPVRAKVASIRGLSAHGDGDDVIRWLSTAQPKPRRTVLVHGEPKALAAMGRRVAKELGCRHHTPKYLEKINL